METPDDDPADWDARAWENVTSDWDETANFTGMDEYWAGMMTWHDDVACDDVACDDVAGMDEYWAGMRRFEEGDEEVASYEEVTRSQR